MGVSLPSDLVADVMRNADPSRLSAARAQLKGLDANGNTAVTFQSVLAKTVNASSSKTDKDAAAYKGLEQFVLRSLFEQLLPGEDSGAFGSGPGAGIWRSMAADQMAGLYADSGGLGIAEMVQDNTVEMAKSGGGWPYFMTDKISAFAG